MEIDTIVDVLIFSAMILILLIVLVVNEGMSRQNLNVEIATLLKQINV